jgi:hypothetical protein
MMKYIFPPTTQRVAFHTNSAQNAQIRDHTIRCLNTFKDCDEHILSEKICKLNHEWDVERYLETGAASLVLVASISGFLKTWCCCFLATGAVGTFLLQHALQGWCPPVPIIRELGVRTAEEISNEKTVLKLLRGDFSTDTGDVSELLAMAEKQ